MMTQVPKVHMGKPCLLVTQVHFVTVLNLFGGFRWH